jgi:hypothetical protein
VNIFFLHGNPVVCASHHCDKHVNKMITEHLQMMSVALDMHGLPPARKKDGEFYSVRAYRKHPCTLWVADCKENFVWLYEMTQALCYQFRLRYGKEHAGEKSLLSIDLKLLDKFSQLSRTPPPQCMPDFCKVDGDSVQAYRNCYNMVKWSFARWDKNPATVPSWFAPQSHILQKPEHV